MVTLWVLSAGIFMCVAGIAARRAFRTRNRSEYGNEPVSTEWLAQARSREEHGW